MSKIRLTKTLLDSYAWVFKKDDGYEDFLRTLNREKSPPTEAMLNGQQFENCVNNALNGVEIDEDHKWYKGIKTMADYLKGSQQQVTLFRDIEVDGQKFLLHGVLDYLRSGVVYDCKFSKSYRLNKYLDSSQHPVYMYLVPEARRFEYLSCDGTWVYKEIYPRDIIPPVENYIRPFTKFCKERGLWKIVEEKWSVKNG